MEDKEQRKFKGKPPLLSYKKVDKLWDEYEIKDPYQKTSWDRIITKAQRDADVRFYEK